MDLALNNQQRMIYHKTQPTNQPTNQSNKWLTCMSRTLLQFYFRYIGYLDHNWFMGFTIN